MATSPQDAEASMIANLKEKTGKSLEQWVKLAASSKRTKHGELVKFLKDDHGLTHGYANLVAHRTLKSDAGSSDEGELVEAQYAGAKAALRPWYDALLAQVSEFGGDVEVAPKKAYVSLRRGKQFAIVQPSTATRLDIGINLKGRAPSGRLEASGSFNSMVSHRVRVSKSEEIDKELIGWLREAYDAS